MRLYETMRTAGADVFIHTGDTIYADGPLQAGGQARRRARLAEPRDAGEEQGRRNARRVPRQPPLQPARRARAALQCVGVAVRDLGRSRSAQQLVSDRDARPGRAPTPSAASRCSRRGPSARSWNTRRPGPIPSIPSASTARAGSGRSSRSSGSTCAAIAGPNTANRQARARRRSPRSSAAPQVEWLKAAAEGVNRDVEDHRERHAARPRRCLTAQRSRPSPTATRGPPLGRELEIAAPAEVHPRPAHPQRRVRHRRRALLRRAPLRSRARGVHRLSSVLGVRRRPGARRHVRPGAAGQDVRPRSASFWAFRPA